MAVVLSHPLLGHYESSVRTTTIIWLRELESNQRPSDYETDALPLRYPATYSVDKKIPIQGIGITILVRTISECLIDNYTTSSES